MADRYISVGSMQDVHVYDDADFDNAIDTDGTIQASGTPTDPNQLVRLTDLAAAVATLKNYSIVMAIALGGRR